jgi:hypothetical protein
MMVNNGWRGFSIRVQNLARQTEFCCNQTFRSTQESMGSPMKEWPFYFEQRIRHRLFKLNFVSHHVQRAKIPA